jgi:hypothetical protein
MKRLLSVVLIIVALGAIATLGWYYKDQHDREIAAERARAVARDDSQRYKAAYDQVARIADNFNKAGAAIAKDQNAATKAGTKRHDESVTGGDDFDKELAYAKTEQTSVIAMGADKIQFVDLANKSADVFDDILGDGRAKVLRSDTDAYDLTKTQELNAWSRAIGDIVDRMEASKNGRSVEDSAVETYYHEAETMMTRADQQEHEVAKQFGGLFGDLVVARARIDADFLAQVKAGSIKY